MGKGKHQKGEQNRHGFIIDFIELSFLAEACIPPRPIARAMFWERLINEIYHQLTDDERKRMFDWMKRNDNFNLLEEGCQWFYARFNPENQYEVSCFYKGKKQIVKAFLKDGLYRTDITIHIDPKYIKSVAKRQIKEEKYMPVSILDCDHIRESDGMICIGGRCSKCNEIV